MNHINQFTSVTLFFNLKPGYTIGQATNFVEDTARSRSCRRVSAAQFQGEALTFRDTVSSLTILMFLAVFVMYVILAILYESYLHPITVLSSLPVALVGGLFTLWLFGAEASLYAFIGMFMLMGIVKKNGIMIVDFAQQRVAQGVKDDQAIHDASMERFRPIMMTTLAALMGALPIALGYGADGVITPAAGTRGGRRTDRFAVHHPLRHSGHLSLPGRVPGKGAGPHDLLPLCSGARGNGPRTNDELRPLASHRRNRDRLSSPVGRPCCLLPGAARRLRRRAQLSSAIRPLFPRHLARRTVSPWRNRRRRTPLPNRSTSSGGGTSFHDPVLNQLIEQAVATNLDVRLAQARVREARAQLQATRAGLFPSANASASYTRSRTSPNTFNIPSSSGTGTSGPVSECRSRPASYKAGFDASWEIDVFGGVRRQVESARYSLEAQIEARRNALLTLLGEVAQN